MTAEGRRSGSPGPASRTASIGITAVFAAIVVWGAVHHEPWRDEVVPLSIALRAGSPAELAEPLKFEGHPILWYLVLWGAYNLVGETWVLKACSVGAAVGAIFAFLRSPLPWWIRVLFTFSFFPLYQYSVIARGYGLEMLLLFAFCALHQHGRARPLALGLVLAALANTEAFGLIMAVAAGVMLLVEGLTSSAGWRTVVTDVRVQAAALVYCVGLALAAAVAFPDPGHPLTGFQRLDPASIAAGIGRAIVHPVAHATQFTVLPLPSLWVWAWFAYLTRRPPVLCFVALALVGIEVLFNLVYGPGAPWHLGNVGLVVVAGMWLDASASTPAHTLPAYLERTRTWLGRVLAAGIAIVFTNHVLLAARSLAADYRQEYSSNQRLGDLLRDDPALASAAVLGEPDTPLWSLPYYADNRIYLPREGVFRDWGVFSPTRERTYDLPRLVRAAREVRATCACPVVITLGWELGRIGTYTNFPGTRFEEHFVITPEGREEFLASVRPRARLRGPVLTDETYDVYVLR
jgi:hypothetical protein